MSLETSLYVVTLGYFKFNSGQFGCSYSYGYEFNVWGSPLVFYENDLNKDITLNKE